MIRRRALLGAAAASLAGCRRARPPGTIDLWFSYGGRNREVLLGLVEAFHAAQPAVRVRPVYQGDYFEGLIKLRTGLFVGSVPTVSHVVGEVIPYLAEAGALSPLDDVGEAVTADLVPALSQAGTFADGGERPLYALPFNRSTPIAYYNRDVFEEAGLSPPTTWEAMREVARKTTSRSGSDTERWGFECPIDWWFWVALTGQAGGRVIEADGTVSLGGAAGAAALRHWQQMIHEDRTMKPPPGRDFNAWEKTNDDFLQGRVAMIWTSTAFLRFIEDRAPFRVGVAPLPKRDRFAVPTGGTFFVIPKGIEGAEREAGLAFLRWMMAAPQANAWATQTGYMPVSQRGMAQLEAGGFYEEHPNFAVTLGQLEHALQWPWAPGLFRVQREAVQPRLEAAVLQRQDASAALNEARGAVER